MRGTSVPWATSSHFQSLRCELMNKKHGLYALFVFATLPMAALAAGDAEAGKSKAALCAACHGADGNSPNPLWPKLAGQHPEYMVQQLVAFKSGERKDPTMSPMASPLSEQDMADVAAFFSSQKLASGAASDQSLAAAGERLYRGGNLQSGVAACMACHGPAGEGNPQARYPRIASQNAAYTEKQLKDFRSGSRATDPNQMMRKVAARMTDQEIKAVAEYVAGLSE